MPQRLVQAETAGPGGHERWQRARDDIVTWTVAGSLLAHALILGLAANWRSSPIPDPEINIPVDLLSPEQYEAETRGRDVSSSLAPTPFAPSTGEPVNRTARADQPDDMIHPARMLSAAALAEPKSRQAREMLPTFEPTERSVQLCNIEAMEQVRAWQPAFRPERIVAYATAEPAIAGDAIHADGAAFFSGGKWYLMRFDCGLSADHESVVSFAFSVGPTIPREAWEAHNLPVGDDLD
jgi:hypothetical protein